jgi:hypothetical protein
LKLLDLEGRNASAEKCPKCIESKQTWMKAKVAEKPKKKAVPLEEDARIVAGTLKGEAEIRAGLGKRFKNADEFIEYLEEL